MARNYSGIRIPYTLSSWKLRMAMGYIRPYWKKIPAKIANKIANAYNKGTDVVFNREDFDALPDELWTQVKPYI